MKIVLQRIAVSLLLLTLVVTAATAQQGSGAITGRVTDSSGAVIPGVTVTLTSPAVMGTREGISDERGSYRFDGLPLGTYTLKYELPGFATLIREGLQITAGFTATINVSLEVATQAETVTVTGQSPVVDLQSATLAVNISPTMLADLPTGRDIIGVMGMAPGIMMSKFDVGGSQAGTSLGFRTYGTDGQNYALVDGVITENNLYGDFGSVQETQVVAASKSADIKIAGAYVNNIVKTGSNDFHGGGEAYWESPRLQGDNLNDRLRSFGLTSTNRVSRFYDLNGDVGGPIKKDRLWWYGSIRRNWIGVFSPGFKKGECKIIEGCRDAAIGTYVKDNPSPDDEVFFTDLPVRTLKLSYQLNLTNQLGYTMSWSDKHQPYRGGFGPDASYFNADSVARQVYPNWIYKGQWTSVITSRVTLDTSYATHRVHWPFHGRVNEYSRRDLDTQAVRGGFSGQAPGFQSGNTGNQTDGVRWQYNIGFTVLTDRLITGSHNFKMGFSTDNQHRAFKHDGTVGQIILYYRDGFRTPAFIETLDTPFDDDNGLKTWAPYINDAWNITRKLTLNLGMRFDHSTPYYPEQRKDGTGPYQAKQVVAARDIVDFHALVPRISFVYDVFGNGKTAVKGSFSRYVIDENRSVATNVNPTARTQTRYVWDSTGPALNCYLTRCAFDPTGRSPVNVTGGRERDIDPNLKYPMVTEYTAGLEQELITDLSLRLAVVRKFEFDRFQLNNDAIPFSAYDIPVNGVDPGKDGVVGTSDDRNIQLWSLQPAFVGKRKDTLRNMPALDHANTTLEATVVKRFSNKWQLLAGWDYLFRKVWTTADVATDLNGIPENPNTLKYNAGQHFGTWHVKTMATYQAPYGLKTSVVWRAAKGEAHGRRWNSPRLNQGVVNLTIEPIGTYFMDNVKLLDFRVEKSFTVSERWGKIAAMFDWFNVLNSSAVTGVTDLTGLSFQRPTRTIEPRIARLGLKYTF